MTFLIITHVPHIFEENHYFAYAPYVREMNIWIKNTDKVLLVSPLIQSKKIAIDIPYEHSNIEFVSIASFDVLGIKAAVETLCKIPKISWTIFKTMQKADHIHLRCPGNIGLLGCLVQILFPNKMKTAKYAGNWDSKSKQPWSYRLQQWILSNTFLTRNIQVLVYGQWGESTKNIKPFFTATYHETDKLPVLQNNLNGIIYFVFVAALVTGKNPLYAIQLVEALFQKGYLVHLDIYGEGMQRVILANYIKTNRLENRITLHGNQTQEIVKRAYQQSHFVILPSESEGWPKAIAEGMFWGCVPLAISTSVVPQMLDSGNRGLLLTGNLEVDVANITAIIKDNVLYQQMASAACDWSRKYTLDVFEEEIEKLL